MSKSNDPKQQTHFGFEKVNIEDKVDRVADVFHSVAKNYDLMNDLMSLGVHRYWKRFTLDLCALRPGQTVLDVAAGTGDLSLSHAQKVGADGLVLMTDINPSMLALGRDRLIDAGFSNSVQYVLADAETLPFPQNTFDCITIAFGLRNVTDKSTALASMLSVLKPGGKAVILEFSKPHDGWFNSLYDWYSFSLLPWLGEIVASDRESYRYLAESIRMHPDQKTLQKMMDDAGFDRTDYHNLSGGIVAVHRGYKA
ncbi:MAG: bifunctional demethylmenaquinone methyltransferase/2-methoxy-6-polyprenyl-1,4-benzoquinol methylase UbiE [Pseudomonadota bacterium]|nr:bifunctional demethylmenaquinone methyltransferase/2-methoxy-6-polyprenyl-1,4-benzoquinol methylase UbiE [Pseudomonadota bacterium]